MCLCWKMIALNNPIKDGGCGEKFVADRIKEHYNSADKFKKIPLRLIGKQAIALARYSFRIMDILIKKSDVRDCRLIKILALSKICEVLRQIGVSMNQISIYNATINEL